MAKEENTYQTKYGLLVWKKLVKRADFENREIVKLPFDLEEVAQFKDNAGNQVTPTTFKNVVCEKFNIQQTEVKTAVPTAQADTTTNLNGIATPLIDYIDEQVKTKKPTQILNDCVKAGWKEEEVRRVINYKITPPPQPQKTPTTPTPTNEEVITAVTQPLTF